MTGPTGRSAVFLDRDGTLIEDTGYVRDPAGVRLLPGVGPAVARLNAAGLPVVVVSNQSGIARGLLTEADYHAVQRRMTALLAVEGARLDGEEFCPHLPELTGPCECRKPGVLLYRRAADRLDLDLTRSWWVGDRLRDALPADVFGGTGILVWPGAGSATDSTRAAEAADPRAARFVQVPDLNAAVDRILARLPYVGLGDYFPAP